MKPILKISRLTNLHDARYCSAVGIGLISFRFEADQSDSISPKDAAEIIGWLSGPQYIGEFGYLPPDEIKTILEAVSLSYAVLPMDYHPDLAADLDIPVIFRPEDPRLSPETILSEVEALAARFPEALFELNFDVFESIDEFSFENHPLFPRFLIGYGDANSIYAVVKQQGTQPFGFNLGPFIEETEGVIDYEKCDDFLEKYEDLAIAD